MKIGNVEIKRTYRPARIVCDVISLALVVVIVILAINQIVTTYRFLWGKGIVLSLLFPLAGVGMCVVYTVLVLKGAKFKRYNITKQNAQSVYDWWAFALALVKLPLLMALIEGEFIYSEWAAEGHAGFSLIIVLYLLLAVIIIRLMLHRIKTLTAVKKAESGDSAVKVKVKIADDDDKRGGRNQ